MNGHSSNVASRSGGLIFGLLLVGWLAVPGQSSSQRPQPAAGNPREVQASTPSRGFDVFEKSIEELQSAMANGATTSAALVKAYLARIDAYDRQGPRLNAMITVNPRAVETARALDRERAAKGPRGPLHGIPLVVKDNFDTADMPTTGGSIALAGFYPPDDAFQVRQLREAGAVIIGKTNLHELAAGITSVSSLGGSTRNPYNPSRNPGGSSGGTGAAVAASFAAAGMGSDTCGSIRIPAAHNSLVGLRGSEGLSSRDGMIPLSHTQDIGGPLARSARDLAILLDVTVGPDPADPATLILGAPSRPRFVEALERPRLKGVRVGVLKEWFGDSSEDNEVGAIVRKALDAMKGAGAELVDVVLPEIDALTQRAGVIDFEFKFDLMDYLAAAPNPPVTSLTQILEGGLYHHALDGTLRRRDAVKARDSDEYRKALAARGAVRQAVTALMAKERLDAIAYPPIRRKAAFIGEAQPGANCRLSATSGLPAISFPAGFTNDGLPVGIELLGGPFQDADLLSVAYAFEQLTHVRRPPAATPPLTSGRAPSPTRMETTATGSGMVPAVATAIAARARFSYDSVLGVLTYDVEVTHVEKDEILAGTIHRGDGKQNGPVVFQVLQHGMSKNSGMLPLTMRDRGDLDAGRLYLQISTRTHPTGAVRGPLTAAR